MLFALLCAASAFGGALEEARKLQPPAATARVGGEDEAADFWAEHEALLRAAHVEHGPLHPDLYTPEGLDRRYVRPRVRELVERLVRSGGADEEELRELIGNPAAGVHSVRLFTPLFGQHMVEELRWLRQAGIPLRRPNGMNRYGVILEDVGMGASLKHLVSKYLAPLAQMLHPEHIVAGDVVEHYAFSIRYQHGEDTSLAAHTDASAFTFNLCLGTEFEGSGVEFFPEGAGAPSLAVPSEPLVALMHRGMLRHGAVPLESGERFNLVIWMFGKDGYVRVAPYDPAERSTATSRWQPAAGSEEL